VTLDLVKDSQATPVKHQISNMVSGRWTGEEHGVFLEVRGALMPSWHADSPLSHSFPVVFVGDEGFPEELGADSGVDPNQDRHSNTHARTKVLARM
jgi:hypothetical protein